MFPVHIPREQRACGRKHSPAGAGALDSPSYAESWKQTRGHAGPHPDLPVTVPAAKIGQAQTQPVQIMQRAQEWHEKRSHGILTGMLARRVTRNGGAECLESAFCKRRGTFFGGEAERTFDRSVSVLVRTRVTRGQGGATNRRPGGENRGIGHLISRKKRPKDTNRLWIVQNGAMLTRLAGVGKQSGTLGSITPV